MANICNNTLEIYTESEPNQKYIKEFFEDVEPKDFECWATVEFTSKWVFPDKEMDDFYQGLPDKNDIEATCLSVEWGNRYCEFHHLDEDGWLAD